MSLNNKNAFHIKKNDNPLILDVLNNAYKPQHLTANKHNQNNLTALYR